ncbi:MAG: IS1380 family transposase [Actinobacteria bacterium]|nr:IS1380 family transposase [Actinomycetota bacterium]
MHASEDSVTPVAGVALWGALLDRLNILGEADRRGVRPIGPGGYTGGECYRALIEILLAGGDFLSDRSLLADEATQKLRGPHALPSHPTMWRFLAGADLGRVMRVAATNREMMRRAWAAGAAPKAGILTIDPDATVVRTYGKDKEGSVHTYLGKPGLHPLVGVIGETGEVLGVRERAGNRQAGRRLASFTTECINAIPKEARDDYQLWVRSDSAGYQREVIDAAEAAGAVWSVTAKQFPNVKLAIYALAADPDTVWERAKGGEEARGSEVADATFTFARRQVRLILRRQPKARDTQLSFDDLDGYRFHAIITNIPGWLGTAVDVEAHHRLRAGIPEDSIKTLKHDYGFTHAPLENFFGNWSWHLACALAHNVALWLKVLALPESFRFCHGKRMRLLFLNLPARITRSARRLIINLPRAYRYPRVFDKALRRIRALPSFA